MVVLETKHLFKPAQTYVFKGRGREEAQGETREKTEDVNRE